MNNKQLRWFTVALIAFNMVWGMGNVVNNYAQQGVSVVTSWLLILAIYFIPYALIVGQLGSAFKDSKGGVSSWVENTTSNKRLAYYAAWTYWVVHIPYLAQKPQAILIAGGCSPRNGNIVNTMSVQMVAVISLIIFLAFYIYQQRTFYFESDWWTGRNSDVRHVDLIYSFSCNGTVHQSNDGICHTTYESSENIYSNIDFSYFTTVSMLVFAVGGAEKYPLMSTLQEILQRNFLKG